MEDLTGKTLQDLIDTLKPIDPSANDPRLVPRDPTTETEPKSGTRPIPFIVSGLPILHTCGHRKLHTWRFDLAGGRVGM